MKKLVTILSPTVCVASISSLTVFAASNSITDVVGTKTHREIEVHQAIIPIVNMIGELVVLMMMPI